MPAKLHHSHFFSFSSSDPISMSMFTIHIERGNALRRLLLPIANVSNTAQINCSLQCLSFVVTPRNNFVAVLRIFPSFFTSFQFNPNFAGQYTSFHARLYLKLLHTNISNMLTDDLSVTVYLNRFQSTVPVRFYDPRKYFALFYPFCFFRFYLFLIVSSLLCSGDFLIL